MDDLAWLPILGGALGLGCILGALHAGRRRRFIDDTPTSKTQGIFIGDVELKGTAECEKPLRSYLADRECVQFKWSIEEHWTRVVTETYTDVDGKTRRRKRTITGSDSVGSGTEQTPFYLKDDTGHVLVRPEGATVEGESVLSVTCGTEDPLYYGKGPSHAVADSDFVRTFNETAVPLHQRLYVMGRAQERKDVVAAEIAQDERATMFLISVREEEAISGGLAWAYWLWVLFGLALALGSFAVYEKQMRFTPDEEVTGYGTLVLGFLAALTVGWIWMVFNSIIWLRERVRQGWANIDVQLKRRHDLLPRLAAVVEGLKSHEAQTQVLLAVLRAQATVSPKDVRGKGTGLVGVSPRLLALMERYPRLTAQKSFLELQRELVRTEQRIALARTYFNNIATYYNARLEVVPDCWVAALARLRPEALLTATHLERAPVEVKFTK